MRVLTEDDIDRVLSYRALVDGLAESFRAVDVSPARSIYPVPGGASDAILALMPAWTDAESSERFIGCKIATMFPGNNRINKPSIYGSYVLLSGETGEPLAVMDGRVLTAWRTAAASALAASFLARTDASSLLMIGAGALVPHLVQAHRSVRKIERVRVWNRTRSRAEATAQTLAASGITVDVVDNLQAAVSSADIVSCATPSREPLVKGAWLKWGTHLDLVGGFTLSMREADDEAVSRARVYVDTRAGALAEAGDIVDPLRRGVIKDSHICGDLFDLCRGNVTGRNQADEITLFKSVGSAIEDLAAAKLVWKRVSASSVSDGAK